jgi:hypothetical protein
MEQQLRHAHHLATILYLALLPLPVVVVAGLSTAHHQAQL